MCAGSDRRKKALTPEEAAEAIKKLEDAQKLKKVVKNLPKVDNAGSITGVVTCQKMRNNADAIVFLEKVGENNFPPAPEHAIIDQLNLTYVPRVVAMQKGTTVDFPNSDAVRHNVFSPPTAALQFNLGTYPTGIVKEVLLMLQAKHRFSAMFMLKWQAMLLHLRILILQ